MLSRRNQLMSTAAIVLVLGLAGCGGGGGSDNDGNPDTGAGGTVDAFVAKVRDIIGMASETAEPVELDAEAITQPETTEPVPI